LGINRVADARAADHADDRAADHAADRTAHAPADAAAAALWETAFAHLSRGERDGTVAQGTATQLRRKLSALRIADKAKQLHVDQLQAKLDVHQRFAKQQSKADSELRAVRTQHAQCKAQVKALKKQLGAAQALSYARFSNDKWLREGMADFVFFENVDSLDAWIDVLDECYPLKQLVWAESNRSGRTADDARKPRKFKLSPKDAVVLFLFLVKVMSLARYPLLAVR
jgi:hypothetical protein